MGFGECYEMFWNWNSKVLRLENTVHTVADD